MPDTSDHQDVRDALLQLSKDIQNLRQDVKQLSREHSKDQIRLHSNQSDRLIQGAIWVLIAAAIVSVVSNFTTILLESLSAHTP